MAMANYQVLFSGDIAEDSKVDAVRMNLARELGIDERKAKQLFSGRTVVIKSQLHQEEALALQARYAELGAVCRVKDLTPKIPDIDAADYRIDKHVKRDADATLKDITAAHQECPRCGHMQLEASHCARCGVDLVAAIKQKRKEDQIIEKKIRELRNTKSKQPAFTHSAEPIQSEIRQQPAKRGLGGWFKKRS
ncbi:MAG: hypothetical protein O7C67_14445 [Gammaproteobacteria bacterium]|nr:hypothetical protein [Gammaproteobacteria bacterium]